MDRVRRRKLEARGWRVGSAGEFLGLSPEESALIELKLHLAERVRQRRKALKITQVALARRLKSSQSRVAKIEAGDPTVSLDLLVRSLLVLGAPVRSLRKIPSLPAR
jgi:ribosome-binding protein aMBF1 (putative translation factor)